MCLWYGILWGHVFGHKWTNVAQTSVRVGQLYWYKYAIDNKLFVYFFLPRGSKNTDSGMARFVACASNVTGFHGVAVPAENAHAA